MRGERLASLVAHAEPLELVRNGVVLPDPDPRDERAATGTQLAARHARATPGATSGPSVMIPLTKGRSIADENHTTDP